MAKQRKLTTIVLLVTGILAVLVVGVVVRYRGELVAWYELRRDFERLTLNAQGRPEYRHRQTDIVFVAVPGGTFLMGSPETEAERGEEEGPVHEVRLSRFLIAKHEVTQEQWEKVMGMRPSDFNGENFPVEQVSWDDCQEFCKLTGLSLPTEAQWEYACRAGTGTPYYSGNTEEDLKSFGWYSGNSEGKVHAVGSKDPNAFGLYDMHGNVWEWCVDVYDAEFYSKREALEKDPVCTSGSEFRVFRGGSWSYIAVRCRSACRGNWHPSHRNLNLGFRPLRAVRE